MKLVKFSLTPPLVAISFALCAVFNLFAVERYVTATGVDDADHGGSWDSAYATITYAINQVKGAATADDPATVWVDDGFVHEVAVKGTVTVPANVILRSKSGDWRTGATIHGSPDSTARCVDLNAGGTIIGFDLVGGGDKTKTTSTGGINGGNRTTSVARNCRITGCCGYDTASAKTASLYDCEISFCTNRHTAASGCASGPFSCNLYNCTVATNKTSGYGIWDCTIQGGAIKSAGVLMNSTASGTTFEGSSAATSAAGKQTFLTKCKFTDVSNVLKGTVIADECEFSGCGAITVSGNTPHPTLLNCKIHDNVSRTSLIPYGNVISNCVIWSNSVDFPNGSAGSPAKGGVFNSAMCSLKVYNTTVSNNLVTLNGAATKSTSVVGIVADASGSYAITLRNCLFANNGSGNSVVRGARLTMYNTAVVDEAGATSRLAHNVGAMVNCSLVRTTGSGETWYNEAVTTAVATNCVFWNGAACGDSYKSGYAYAPVNCCSAQAAADPTEASFSTDPQLNAVSASPTFLMPLKGSPCIDKCRGDCDFAWMRDPNDLRSKDIYGNDRVVGTYADIGAIEYFDPTAVTYLLTVSGTPRAYGQAVPEYGAMKYETGDFTYELAGGETIDDKTWHVTAEGDARANFVSVTYQSGASAAETLTEFPFTRPLNAATTVTWAFENEEYRARATVSSPIYGRVSVAGGAPGAESAAWVAKDGTATLSASAAHPAAAFVQWTGPSASLLTPDQRTSPTITVVATEPIDLVAEFSGPYIPTVVKTSTSTWNGYPCDNYTVDGHTACVVRPSKAVFPAGERPWTWTMKWWEAFVTESGVPDLVGRGYYHTWIDTFAGRCRTDEELALLNGWQLWVVNEYKLVPKVRLIGMSWGGFYCGRYAAKYPDDVLRIYFDNPLMNFQDFTGAPEIGADWEAEKPASGNWNDDPRMPVNRAADIAAAGIPVLMYRSTADKTVLPGCNSELFAARFQQAGGDYREVVREGADHHPHGRTDANDLRILKFMTGVDAEGNIYVSQNGDDASSGGDWAHAFRTISYAMSWAMNGDTIWVDDGYEHEVATDGTVTVPAGVTLRSRSGDWRTGATIHGAPSSTARCVELKAGGTIIGFDIIGGGDEKGTADIGGINGGNRTTSVARNCRITASRGYSIAAVSTASLYDCEISFCTNRHTAAGGCASGPYSCNLYNCTVATNKTNGYGIWDCKIQGGAIKSAGSFLNSTASGTTFDNTPVRTSTAGKQAFLTKCKVTATSNVLSGDVIADECEFSGCGQITMSGEAPHPTLLNCKIHDNVSGTSLIPYGNVISNCVIWSNSVDFPNGSAGSPAKGGVFNSAMCSLKVYNTTVSNNLVTLNGAATTYISLVGIVADASGNYAITLRNCLFANNGSGNSVVRGARLTMYNTAVVDEAGATSRLAHNVGAMVNCSLVRTTGSGETWYNEAVTTAVATNCVFWNGAACGDSYKSGYAYAPVNCCSAQAAADPTGRSFSTDPHLNAVSASPAFLMPRKGSPCIDKCTGDCDFAWMRDPSDLRSRDVYGNKRVFGAAADIGAIEYKPTLGLLFFVR